MTIALRLTVGLTVAVSGLLVLAAFTSYRRAARVLTGNFDDALLAKAHALATTVETDEHGKVKADVADAEMTEFTRSGDPEYFQVQLADGRIVERSPSLASTDLPSPGTGDGPVRFWDLALPDGRSGRAVACRVVPHAAEEGPGPGTRVGGAGAGAGAVDSGVTLVVARERRELDRTLTLLLSSLLGSTILASVAVGPLVMLVVRAVLAPLRAIAAEADRLDASSLGRRFATRGIPPDLEPVCRKLNDLLERLDGAFQRERRFTADVAHELRTPVAELRSLAQVAIKFPPAAGAAEASFRDALAIATRMQAIVTTLLAMVRNEGGTDPVAREPVDLVPHLREVWKPLGPAAAARGLTLEWRLPAAAFVHVDRAMLHSITSNVLGNAAEYASEGGSIMCRVDDAGGAGGADGGFLLTVSNTNDRLTAEDLPHLGEPFWRKDSSRNDPAHCGLGLALVASLARRLGVNVRFTLPQPDRFVFAAHFA